MRRFVALGWVYTGRDATNRVRCDAKRKLLLAKAAFTPNATERKLQLLLTTSARCSQLWAEMLLLSNRKKAGILLLIAKMQGF